MHIFTELETLSKPSRGGVVALGNFDGVHLGHQAVLRQAAIIAKEKGVSLGVMITEPHPVKFFKPHVAPFRLTPKKARLTLLAELGVDWAYVLPFDAAIAGLTADTFIKNILGDRMGVSAVIAGQDYRFGKGRTGDIDFLNKLGPEAGFSVIGIELVEPEAEISASLETGKILSSTTIRKLVQTGNVRDAARLLGHWWRVEGPVIKGDQRGRTIGFPTANVQLGDSIRPKEGVYAIRVCVEENWYDGVANFGHRPTFDKKDQLLEAHLFDFNSDLYGKSVLIEFVTFIRPEQKFNGLDALKAQIVKDSDQARHDLTLPKNERNHHLLTKLCNSPAIQ